MLYALAIRQVARRRVRGHNQRWGRFYPVARLLQLVHVAGPERAHQVAVEHGLVNIEIGNEPSFLLGRGSVYFRPLWLVHLVSNRRGGLWNSRRLYGGAGVAGLERQAAAEE